MISYSLDPTILRSKTASKLVKMLIKCSFLIGDGKDAVKIKKDIEIIRQIREEEINKPSTKKRTKEKNGS